MNSQPWLVTGAAGFLGSHVVEQLLARQQSVIALDNLSTGNWDFLAPFAGSPLFKFFCRDIRDQVALTEVCTAEKPAVAVHLAALHFIPAALRDPRLTVSLNVQGTRSLLSACRKAKVKRLWFASTGDVYKPIDGPCQESSELAPFNIYGLTKWKGEKLIKSEASAYPERHFVIGRLFNLYGPHETNPHILPEIIHQLRNGGSNVLRLGTITAKRDLVPVADAARAVLDTVQNSVPGVTTVNIGTGVSVSIEEVLAKISELIGIPLKTEIDPEKVRVVERPHLQADVRALQSLIGWTPHRDLSRGLHELLRFERVLS
ncbi:MAG TPA: NAD-dependent epimerase/dehydratase family protein [Terriglobales bacterium]|jgi:UDP-glucose 4-epimerase|nr:NAD-dependent epimerase/dehydratase family protein [Terriglobales bacterium]